MRFECQQCATKYTISDDRVRGKVLRIRCKKCQSFITLSESAAVMESSTRTPARASVSPASTMATAVSSDSQQGPLSRESQSASADRPAAVTPSIGDTGAILSQGVSQEEAKAAPSVAMEEDASAVFENWYVSIEGEQKGPLSLKKARTLVENNIAREVYVWTERLGDWRQYHTVMAFSDLYKKPQRQRSDVPGLPLQVTTTALPAAAVDPSANIAPWAEGSSRDSMSDGGDDFSFDEVSRVVKLPGLTDLQQMGTAKATALLTQQIQLSEEELQSMRPKKRVSPILWMLLLMVAVGGAIAAIVLVIDAPKGINQDRSALSGGAPKACLGCRYDPSGALVKEGRKGRGDDRQRLRKSDSPKRSVGSAGSNDANNTRVVAGSNMVSGPISLELTPDDIIKKSRSTQLGFSRCYERARRKDVFLKVSKLNVDVKVGPGGTVTSSSISKLSDHYLGKCLLSRIRSWKFRPTKKGIVTRFPIVFQQR